MALGRKSSTHRFFWPRLFRAAVIVAATLASLVPQPAAAWPCGWRTGCYGSGYAYGYGFAGCGFSSYRSFTFCSPGFFSGGIYPIPYGCAPVYCCAPLYGSAPLYGFAPAYGCGLYPFVPIINPFPSAFAPVYGPAGVMPFLGISASAAPAAGPRQFAAARPAVHHPQRIDQQRQLVIRASNNAARFRAAKLVAVGDRHLRDAARDPRQLAAALDAYRRAGAVAADLPDTFLREAIVLAALDRSDDAATAVARAAAIDARLATAPAAIAAAERLPPDPVFGDRPLGAPSTLATRSARLLENIFRDDVANGVRPEANWIADRWSRQKWIRESLDGVHAVAKK